MKIALALLLLAVPAAFAADNAKAQKEVAAAVESWKTALLKGDAAALDKLYHPDLTYVHSGAKNETKAVSIAASTKPEGIPKAIEFNNATTRIYGNTALFKTAANLTNAAGVVSHLDILTVWIKGAQGWQLVARQAVKIP